MPITVHTIPEGQREVERLEKLVQEQQETIAAISQKQTFDAEHYKRESAIDAAKIKQQHEQIADLKTVLAQAVAKLDVKGVSEINVQLSYLRKKYPEL